VKRVHQDHLDRQVNLGQTDYLENSAIPVCQAWKETEASQDCLVAMGCQVNLVDKDHQVFLVIRELPVGLVYQDLMDSLE
jgi:hypothetical protein